MPNSPKDTCIHDIRARILAVELMPGADLDEIRLTKKYGISRTPLREILQRLAGSGYVSLSANRGARVGPLEVQDCRKLFQVTPVIMDATARLAAQKRIPKEAAVLKEALSHFRRSTKQSDAVRTVMAAHRVQMMISHMAHNAYLGAALERALIDVTRLAIIVHKEQVADKTTSIQVKWGLLEKLAACVLAGDRDGAADASAVHLMELERVFHNHMQSEALPVRNMRIAKLF